MEGTLLIYLKTDNQIRFVISSAHRAQKKLPKFDIEATSSFAALVIAHTEHCKLVGRK